MADSTTHLDTLSTSTANNELRVNETADALSPPSLYGRRASTTTGLTWGYYGGRWGGTSIANGTVTLSNGTNYVVAHRSTGAVTTSTSTTNWNTPATYMRLYQVVAASSQVSSYQDHRLGNNGVFQTVNQADVWVGGLRITAGSGTPEGAVTAPIGSLFLRSDGGAGTSLYVKESGTGNTGWAAK